MSSEDPRERAGLCGQELVDEFPFDDLTEKYDPETWHEAEDGTHYCCREVWDGADTDWCTWHADVADKSDFELVAAWSGGPTRLDRAVLRESDLPSEISLSGCHLPEADLRGVRQWGADLGDAVLQNADLGGADLRQADFRGATLFDADLGEANLRGADFADADLPYADLDGADLSEADLHGANLPEADLVGADLPQADLDGADLREATLEGADLREATFEGAGLRGTDLTACELHQTTFEDATFDESTTFGASSGHEIEADDDAEDASWLASHVSSRLRGIGRPSTDPEPLEKAETQYRTVQRLRREHDLKQDPALEIQEKHARRKRALAERNYLDWLKLAVYRWPIGYGEQPRNVVGTSLAVVGLSALLYPLFGLRVGKAGLDATSIGYPFDGVGLVTGLGKSLYFSVITFTTLGYGDVQPLGHGEALATAESLVGAFLMALLVYVLGRRATW